MINNVKGKFKTALKILFEYGKTFISEEF